MRSTLKLLVIFVLQRLGLNVLLILTLQLLPSHRSWAQGIQPENPFDETLPMHSRRPPSKRFSLDVTRVPEVRLPALESSSLLTEDAEKEKTEGSLVGPIRMGVGRDLEPAVIQSKFAWHVSGDHQNIWVLDITTPGAVGVRLHFVNVRLQPTDEIAVYAPDLEASNPDAEYYEPFDTNRRQGEFWTGTIIGSRVRIEFLSARQPSLLPFTIDRLQHIYRYPGKLLHGDDSSSEKSETCQQDVSCPEYSKWINIAHGVAGLGFIPDHDMLWCTGQLLATEQADLTPYFLTAKHCEVDTTAKAKTAEIYWLYETPTCNGKPPDIFSTLRSKEASYIARVGPTDYTLIMIEGTVPVPNKLKWLQWSSQHVPNGTPVVGIHHPHGTFKRISLGTKVADHGPLYIVKWNTGFVTQGSSGSALFDANTQKLIGHLSSGNIPNPSCENPGLINYGAFYKTYTSIGRDLLKVGSDDNLEPNDTCATAHSVHPGTFPNLIVKSLSPDWYSLAIPPQKALTVELNFITAHGDINAALYSSCGGNLITQATGEYDFETFTFTNQTNTATTVFWKVYLADDVRNSYDMKVKLDDACPASSKAICNPCTSRNNQLAGSWYESEGSDSSLFPSHLTFIKQGPANGRLDGFGESASYFLTEDCSGIGVTDSLGRLIVTYSFELDSCGLRLENWNRKRLYCKGGLHNCPAGCSATGTN